MSSLCLLCPGGPAFLGSPGAGPKDLHVPLTGSCAVLVPTLTLFLPWSTVGTQPQEPKSALWAASPAVLCGNGTPGRELGWAASSCPPPPHNAVSAPVLVRRGRPEPSPALCGPQLGTVRPRLLGTLAAPTDPRSAGLWSGHADLGWADPARSSSGSRMINREPVRVGGVECGCKSPGLPRTSAFKEEFSQCQGPGVDVLLSTSCY